LWIDVLFCTSANTSITFVAKATFWVSILNPTDFDYYIPKSAGTLSLRID
jgi:hypothetical protein